MEKLHKKLVAKYPLYARWHDHPWNETYHWALLLIVTGILATNVFANINKTNKELDNFPPGPLVTPRHGVGSGAILGSASDHILVAFKSTTASDRRNMILTKHALKKKSELSDIGVDVITITGTERPEEAVRALLTQESADIDFAEIDAIVSPSFIPNDPSFANEWHHMMMNSPKAWDTVVGSGVTIGIADSGILSSHPDLATHLVAGWNFFDNNGDTNDVYGHGTAVAGTAAAVGNNLNGVAGGAFAASIMPLRVTDTNGNGYYSTIAAAINYAADHGLKIVNVSFQAGGSTTIQRAAKYLWRKGGMTVMSEGNSGQSATYSGVKEIVNVGATDPSDLIMSWSTFGNDIDVSAPGFSILTTNSDGGYGLYSGTSFAAPLTAGVLSLIWSVNPNFTPDQVQSILFDSGTDLGIPGWDQWYGWGRIDAARAVDLAIRRNSTGVSSPSGKKR